MDGLRFDLLTKHLADLQNDSSVSANSPNNCIGAGYSGSGCAAS